MSTPVWQLLPDIAMAIVYGYLDNCDRFCMALCCRNWLRLFKHPTLWRSQEFDFSGLQSQDVCKSGCQFARTFGRHIRKLTITCGIPSFHTQRIIQQSVESFLFEVSNIRGLNLTSFSAEHMHLSTSWFFIGSRNRLVAAISRFLRRQVKLESVDLSAMHAPVDNACRLIDSVSRACGDTLSTLVIDDLFIRRAAAFLKKRYLRGIQRFTSLKTLSLNYDYISEDIVRIFGDSLGECLESLTIKVNKNSFRDHLISTQGWNVFREDCPNASVAIHFESMVNFREMKPILVRGIPMKECQILGGYDQGEWCLSETINHISEYYKDIIENMTIHSMKNPGYQLDEAMLTMLDVCKKISQIYVTSKLKPQTVETICQLQIANKIDLDSCQLHLISMCDLDKIEVNRLRRKYQDLFSNFQRSFAVNIKSI